MRRIKSLLLILTLCVLAVASVGCNRVHAGRISEIAGTYKLEKYEVTNYYDQDNQSIPEEERVTNDYIAEMGMEVYVVITESGMGYYIYKDNQTARYCKQVKQNYTYETDYNEESGQSITTDKIEKIELDDLSGFTVSLYVQADRKTFTDNKAAWQTHFTGAWSGKKYYIGNNAKIQIKYERVSRKQDLSYVEGKVKETLTYKEVAYNPFINNVYYGMYPYDYMPTEGNIYDYYFFNVDTKKVKHCYAVKGDNPVAQEEELDFTYDANSDKYVIGGVEYRYGVNGAFYLETTVNEKVYQINYISSDEQTLRAGFETEINNYVNGSIY